MKKAIAIWMIRRTGQDIYTTDYPQKPHKKAIFNSLRLQQKKTMENSNELTVYTPELGKVKEKIGNIINLVLESGMSVNTVRENLKQLEDQKQILEPSIKDINDNVRASTVSEEMISVLIERSRDFIRTKNIPECRNFIENYIEKVMVYNDHVEVIFKINIPSSENNVILPLKSQEHIKVLQKDYKNVDNIGTY